ncbi:MAG: hypothetical protein NVS3B20_20220 [Polyangiales bacterium]
MATVAALSGLVGVLGCATALPPKELVEARSAYKQAEAGPAAKVKPAELHEAQAALQRAEDSFKENGDAPETANLGYVAQRKSQLADALALTVQANDQRAAAERDLGLAKDGSLAKAKGDLNKTKEQLAEEQRALTAEKEKLAAEKVGRAAAEKRAKDALDALAKSLSVKEEPRGTVITLSGSVLFASGQSTLLDSAKTKLDQVAEALKGQAEHHFTVEGHTDSQGTDAINEPLSKRRAEAVRDYLVVKGISADMISAAGMGSARSVADNKTPEGRANNRRVEIIVEPDAPKK